MEDFNCFQDNEVYDTKILYHDLAYTNRSDSSVQTKPQNAPFVVFTKLHKNFVYLWLHTLEHNNYESPFLEENCNRTEQ